MNQAIHSHELRLPTTATRRGRLAQSWRRHRFAYALIAPAVVFMLAVHLIPTGAGVYLSFLRLNTFTFAELFDAPWTGLQNYRDVLFDEANPLHSGFTNAVRNTAFYTAWTVGLTLVAAMGIALLLHRDFPGRRTVRTMMIAPWVVPSFVVAILWQFMWVSDSGIINTVLVDWAHVLDDKPVWLLGENSMWAIVIPSIWRALPFTMLVFLAGLQAVPDELYEAASIDGANAWQRFRYITLPLLKPLIAIQLLFGVIYSVYQFAIPYVMLGTNPGPYADLLMTLIVRQSFTNNLFGYGAAISTLLMFAMLGWVAVWYLSFRRSLEPQT
ncbi:MAG TPA: sugar ABC transporter permease [Thermoanaerobaculia bacterium]|nr:sugar ABC transporter permease [Thermoanaerobaculia bacterium]